MSGVLIINPLAVAAAPDAGGTAPSNLLTADPNEAWVAASAAPVAIDIDMGGAVTADSFCLAYTNATVDATWTIYSATGLGAGLVEIVAARPMRAGDSVGPRHHCFVRAGQAVVSRYFRIVVDQGGAVPLFAGALVIGRAFEKHRERGPGRTLVDLGAREELMTGGFGMGDGVIKAQFAFSFIDLTDAEVYRLEAIQRDRGLRRPVLLVEDADLVIGQNEAIHYGVFERFQALERTDADVSRWAGSIVEWA